jgi:hypothetical protein
MELGIAISIGVATLLTGNLGAAFVGGIVLASILRGLSLFVPEPIPGNRPMAGTASQGAGPLP